MTDTDLAPGSDGDAFTPEETAAFEAYERGEDAPAVAQSAPQAGDAPALGAEGGEPAAAAGEPSAAAGEVVDPDAPDADDAEKNRGRFVRHGAFHKEREGRKAERARAEAAESALNELRERYARGDERLRMLTEAVQQRPAAAQPQAEPAEAPDPERDIFGYAKHLERQIAELKNGFTKQSEEQRARDEQATVQRGYETDAQRFIATEPHFAAAYNHLYQSRALELAAAGVPEDKLVSTIRAEEMEIAAACLRAGVSPAERIFAIAKARGFAPKAPEPAAAVAPAAPAENAAQRMERVAAGQAGPGKSLSAAGGAPAGEVTFETLASMSEADFEAFALKNPQKLARLMGAEA